MGDANTSRDRLNRHTRQRGRATSMEGQATNSTMLHPIQSILSAMRAAKDIGKHLLWIRERPAKLFHEPGWVELQPHRDGAVLFFNPARASKLQMRDCAPVA